MEAIRYKIYPSLLDKFQAFLDSEQEAESFFNVDSEGNLKRTADEIADQREKELIDSINRVEHEPSEAADKGTCFNEVIDCLLENRGSKREDVVIKSIRSEGTPSFIGAQMDGFTFGFDTDFCLSVASDLAGATAQQLVEAVMTTKYGPVLLYGYADYIKLDKVIDLKTTSSTYNFGKFEKYWQKDVYPWCLQASGLMQPAMFQFYCVQFNKSQPLLGKVFKEDYTYVHAEAEQRIRRIVEHFIEWLENHRDLITDKKVFGGEKEAPKV